jgi:phosphate transport system permease protein
MPADAADSPVKRKRAASMFKSPRPFEAFIQSVLFFCGAVSILTTVGIVITLGNESINFFTTLGLVDGQRRTAAPMTAEDTRIVLTGGGFNFQVNDTLFVEGTVNGQPANELMLVTEVIDRENLVVQRGYENTQAVPHDVGVQVEKGKRVLLSEFLKVGEFDPTTGQFMPGRWQPQIAEFSAIPLISATLYSSLLAMLIAVPVGLGTAIYLSEYAAPGVRATLKPILEVLAGVPTVVFGYFALNFITPALRGSPFGIPMGGGFPLLDTGLFVTYNGLLLIAALAFVAFWVGSRTTTGSRRTLLTRGSTIAALLAIVFGVLALPDAMCTPGEVGVYNLFGASIVVGILIIPTISTISEDALRAVPRSLREASYGLGATRLETVFRVLIPAALSGILAAVLLGISRAVGETMVMALASGAGPNLSVCPFEAAETIAGHIARISSGDLSYQSMDYNSLFALGLTLFIMTLILNLLSNYITSRFREVYQ